MNTKNNENRGALASLFFTFARIGLFTFGGGYAMIAMIERYCVEEKQWITHDEMMDVTVIAESTPGPIAINCATYVGWKQRRLAGAAAATLGIVAPSFLIIFFLSGLLARLLDTGAAAGALRGIRLAVGVLILDAGLGMLKKMPKKPLPRCIALGAMAVLLAVNLLSRRVSSVVLMLIGGAVSLTVFLLQGGKGKGGGGGQ